MYNNIIAKKNVGNITFYLLKSMNNYKLRPITIEEYDDTIWYSDKIGLYFDQTTNKIIPILISVATYFIQYNRKSKKYLVVFDQNQNEDIKIDDDDIAQIINNTIKEMKYKSKEAIFIYNITTGKCSIVSYTSKNTPNIILKNIPNVTCFFLGSYIKKADGTMEITNITIINDKVPDDSCLFNFLDEREKQQLYQSALAFYYKKICSTEELTGVLYYYSSNNPSLYKKLISITEKKELDIFSSEPMVTKLIKDYKKLIRDAMLSDICKLYDLIMLLRYIPSNT